MRKTISILLTILVLFTLFQGALRENVVKGADYQWVPVNNGLTNLDVSSLAIDPTNTQIIYAGTDGGGVFKSTDGGVSWAQMNTGLTNNKLYSLAIDPTNSQTIYAGIVGSGVLKSTNGGTNWSQMNTGLTTGNVQSLAIDPTNTQIIYAGTNGGTFKYVPSFPDFSISASPSSQSVTQGGSTTYTVTLTSLNGFNSPVSLSVAGLPSGYTFNPSSLTPTGSSTLTVYTQTSTPTGTYPITISASGGGKTHTAQVTLNVTSPTPTFTVDIWVDKGCGSTYQLGDYIRIYGRSSVTVDATYIVQRPDGTFPNTRHLNANTDTVLAEGNLDGPTGQRTYTLRATYGGETKEKSCSINVGSSSTTLTVDIWIDRGCGSTYKVGESGRVYLKTNMDAYIELYWSTNGSTPELFDNGNVTANNTYYDDFTIAAPVGTEVVTIKATAGGQTATKSCTFYSQSNLLSAPSLISPTNGQTVYTTTPKFSWSGVNADKYELYIRDSSGTQVYDNNNITSTYFTIPSGYLSNNQTFFWKVRGYNSSGWGVWSGEWSFTVKIITPGPPKNLKAIFSDSSITLTWTGSVQGTNPIGGYAIYRGTSAGDESSTPIETLSGFTTTRYEDKNVTLGTTYYYYVKAFDNQSPPNYSDPSNEVNITFKRLPVLLVHGFQPLPGFNPEDIWKEMATILSGSDSGVNLKDSSYQYNLWYFKAKDSEHLDVYISDYTHDHIHPSLLSIDDYSVNLMYEINEVEKNRGHCSKVNIVAHSMGGLIARRYVESKDFGFDYYGNDVDNLIMIGTPNHGTVVANKWINPDAPLTTCAKQMTTPSDFLRDLNKGVTCEDKKVNYYTFAGELLAFDNSKSSEAYVLPEDSVVSVSSVALSDSEAPGVKNYTVQYSDHSGLINDENVCNIVKDILSGKSVDKKIIESNEIKLLSDLDLFHKESSEELYVHCPVNVTVKNTNGMIINTKGTNQIPGAYVEVIGEEKFFYLPANQTYTIELDAYDKGNVSLEMLYLNVDTHSISVTAFKDIPVNSNSKMVSSTIQANNVNFVLNVDSDGNGAVDYQKTPDIVGNVTTSTQLPTVEFTMLPAQPDGLNGFYRSNPTVQLSTPNGKNVYYKIDNKDFAIYSGSLSITEGNHTVSAYAVDVNGIKGNIVSKSISVDITPPALTVAKPVMFDQVNKLPLIVEGKTEPNASVTVNGSTAGVNSDGSFVFAVQSLQEGTVTNIEVIATDAAGNSTKKSVTVKYSKSSTMILQINNPIALINNSTYTLEAAPVIYSGRTMVPLRFIGEAFGAEFAYESTTKTIYINFGSDRIIMQIGKKTAIVNGKEIALDVAPFIVNGRTLVPIRFISETFGADVQWDGTTKKITITYQG